MNDNDKALLVKVVSIQSSINDDTNINNFIESYLNGIDGISVTKDQYGNIYATKGTGTSGYKCIVSHTDTVHRIYKDRKIFAYDDTLFSMSKVSTEANTKSVHQVGIGGDDKCGVYTCLKAMSDFNDIKSVFFRFEESGCRGSNASNISFFDDCNFVVQCDRRGNSNFITEIGVTELASKEFVEKMKPIYKKYGFSTAIGLSTDIGALKVRGLKVSACNLSCGYYDPHTDEEVINMKDLQNTYNMVCEMFNTYGNRKFEHIYTKKIYSNTYGQYSIYRPESQFTLNLENNYFSSVINNNDIDVEIIECGEADMIEIANSGMYKFIQSPIIDIEEDACPECGSINKLIYIPGDASFFCTESGHCEYVNNDDLFRNLKMTCNNTTYVYNRIYDSWLVEADARWSESLQTYVSTYINE